MHRAAALVLASTSFMVAPASFAQTAVAPHEAPQKSSPEASLPTGKEVLAKYVEATGGTSGYDAIKTRIAKGTIEIPAQNLKGTIVTYQDNAGHVFAEIELAGMGKFMQGFDGTTCWDISPMSGARIVDGIERDQFIRANALDADIHPDKYFTSLDTTGIEQVDGKDAYRVVVTTKAGDTETRFYDKESALLLSTKIKFKSPGGDMAVNNVTSDYKDAGGVKLAHRTAAKANGFEQIVVINEVLSNQDIPADKLTLPEDVKKLLAKGGDKKPETKPETPSK